MTDKKPTLCLDFDGVLHAYTSGWKGATEIPDGPVPGATEFLREAVKHFDVAIYSTRSSTPEGIAAMKAELSWWLIDALFDKSGGGAKEGTDVFRQLSWPTEKPPAFLTIDDRAMTFTGTFPTIPELLAFKTWQGK